jgi:hypothetical protein
MDGVLSELDLTHGEALISLASLMPIVAFYMLLDWHKMIATIDNLIPPRNRETVRTLARQVDAAMAGFCAEQPDIEATRIVWELPLEGPRANCLRKPNAWTKTPRLRRLPRLANAKPKQTSFQCGFCIAQRSAQNGAKFRRFREAAEPRSLCIGTRHESAHALAAICRLQSCRILPGRPS